MKKINYEKAWKALRRDLNRWIKRWGNAPAGTVRKDVLQDMDRIRKKHPLMTIEEGKIK